MRHMTFAFALLLLTAVAFGQELKKGNLVGTHVLDVKLKPGVTTEQFNGFLVTKYIPALEKNYTGWKVYFVKKIRGEAAEGFGLVIVVTSEKERDKYYNSDGNDSDLGKAAREKLKSLDQELAKLGTMTTKYTDWLVY